MSIELDDLHINAVYLAWRIQKCRFMSCSSSIEPKEFTMQNAPILVIGSTGKTGSRIVKSLNDKGFSVREGSRNSAIPFDWEQPETWTAALEGVSAAYVSYFPDLAFPGAAEKIKALTVAANKAGVRKLVLLSGRGKPMR